jgi:hypothetical protein
MRQRHATVVPALRLTEREQVLRILRAHAPELRARACFT